MRVRMLGTGSADGWPNAWCGCASCRAAAEARVVRGSTSALVDDRLLLEIGPDTPRAAVRAGADLTGVEAVLVTHAHPDHLHWPAFMWRGWAAGRRPLTLLAPPAVLEVVAPHLDSTVTPVEAAVGSRHALAGHQVRVLPATHGGSDLGPAVLYDVRSDDGASLLWATDTGRLGPEALALTDGRAYDAVLLELTGTNLALHQDLTTWPEQVAELRRRGAVVATTAVHAVHLGHDNPPPAELDAVLAGWGASALRDGDLLTVGGDRTPAAARAGRRVLVLGGARSGKSAYAERRLAAEPSVTYVATAPPRDGDDEWADRVREHVRRRPASWATVETGDVAQLLRTAAEALLVDDLGLWLVRAVDAADAWEGPLDAVDAAGDELVRAWRDCRTTVVLVAPEVGSGVVPATASGRRFRDLLGALTTRLAAGSDEVVQVVAGLPRPLRQPADGPRAHDPGGH